VTEHRTEYVADRMSGIMNIEPGADCESTQSVDPFWYEAQAQVMARLEQEERIKADALAIEAEGFVLAWERPL
jgi:hypothetical protein